MRLDSGALMRTLERRLRAPREVPTWCSPDHILLASFPKSGNTWLRFIISNLSRRLGGHSLPVDFHSVARYVPEIRRNRALEGRIETPGFPLFLKTHFPCIRGFSGYRSVVVIRDPADTLVSYHRHLTGAAGKKLPEMDAFVRHWRYGIDAWRAWYSAWEGHASFILRYEDLLVDALGRTGALLEAFDISVDNDSIESSVARSSKDSMRRAQQKRGDPHPKNRDYQFVGKATSGTAREILDADLLDEIYESAGAVAQRFGYGQPDADRPGTASR